MLEITVCVGNACLLKGSAKIFEVFQELIIKNNLQDKVRLKESYCQGHCRRGASVKIGDEYIINLQATNAEEIFEQLITKSL